MLDFIYLNLIFFWHNLKKLRNENAQGEYYLTDLLKIAKEENQKLKV